MTAGDFDTRGVAKGGGGAAGAAPVQGQCPLVGLRGKAPNKFAIYINLKLYTWVFTRGLYIHYPVDLRLFVLMLHTYIVQEKSV